MPRYEKLKRPGDGSSIEIDSGGEIRVPDDPIVPYIVGDGIGSDISPAARKVLDSAVDLAFKGKRAINWFEIYAGDKARIVYGPDVSLPEDTLQAIQEFGVALKGPLTNSLDHDGSSPTVEIRRKLSLSVGLRSFRWIKGVPSPLRSPEKIDLVVVFDNSEDIFSAHEWSEGSLEARKLIAFGREELNIEIKRDSSVGIRPISVIASKRVVRNAIKYAVEQKRSLVTLCHQGNLMKKTEGAFRTWGYELAKDEFPDTCLTRDEILGRHGGRIPKGRIMIDDCIAASLFRQILLYPQSYDVLVCPGMSGISLSSVCAGLLGGAGMAPSVSMGDGVAVFDTSHGTAPKHADKDSANPMALILAGKMLLEYLGWRKAGRLVEKGIQGALASGHLTADFCRVGPNRSIAKCSEFTDSIIKSME